LAPWICSGSEGAAERSSPNARRGAQRGVAVH
jgi:hypothetical protein